MNKFYHSPMARIVSVSAALLIGAVVGCGSSGPPVHPVSGKLDIKDSPVEVLAGHSVEAVLEADPQIRAFGQIQEDGSFALQTLSEGVIRDGVLAGTYHVRIVLSDDDSEARRATAKLLHNRFFRAKTSGLSFTVPTAENVQLHVSRR